MTEQVIKKKRFNDIFANNENSTGSGTNKENLKAVK